MPVRRVVAIGLCALMAVSVPSISMGGESTGVLDGRVRADARRMSELAVQLRDTETGKVFATVSIDPQGFFAAKEVPVGKPYLLELIRANVKNTPLLCTAGPYQVPSDPKVKTNARLDCGRAPAMVWVMAAAAGTAGMVSFVTRSASQ